MSLDPAIADLEALQERAPIALLRSALPGAVTAAKLDRSELTLVIERAHLRPTCSLLKSDLHFSFLADVTCVDWHPTEPRFEVIYHLLSIPRKERLRLKVRVAGGDASLESVTSVWPAADFFEREVFDLLGVRFQGHPNLRRLLMPEDWEGHPLRKDYPVEGYR
jgi:NADH-quinone oxidoreductase subunit C